MIYSTGVCNIESNILHTESEFEVKSYLPGVSGSSFLALFMVSICAIDMKRLIVKFSIQLSRYRSIGLTKNNKQKKYLPVITVLSGLYSVS